MTPEAEKQREERSVTFDKKHPQNY